jgi:hypothetical protein
MRAVGRAWYGVAVACATILTGVGWARSDHLFACGLAFLLVAGVAFSHSLLVRPISDVYEQGHQAGFDKGYMEGRRVARPVVVDLKPWDEDSEKVG